MGRDGRCTLKVRRRLRWHEGALGEEALAGEATPEVFEPCVEAVKELVGEQGAVRVQTCCGEGTQQSEMVGWVVADVLGCDLPGAVKARSIGKVAAKEAAHDSSVAHLEVASSIHA